MLSYSETNIKIDLKIDFLTKWIQTGFKDSINIARNISDDDLRKKLNLLFKTYQLGLNNNVEDFNDYDDLEEFLSTIEFFFSEDVDNVFDYVFAPAWNKNTNELTVVDIDDYSDDLIVIDDDEYIDQFGEQNLYFVIKPIMEHTIDTIIKNCQNNKFNSVFVGDTLVNAITTEELQYCRESFIDYINKVRESLIKYLNDKNLSAMSDTTGSGEF